MDRLKQFLRAKGFYIALGVGILAFVSLMVVHNYNTYKEKFGVGEPTVDLNAPEDTEDTQQAADAQTEMPGVTEANSGDVLAGDTDATEAADGATQVAKDTAADTKNTASTDQTRATDNTDGQADDKTAEGNMTQAVSETADESVSGDTDTANDEAETVETGSDGIVVANAYNEGGVLVWPVEGKVVLPYSMDTTIFFKTLKSYRCNPGVLISASEGENVLSAYEGVVESVDTDPEYGTTVTINMGNGYKATYGQLMNVTVEEGDAVSTAENIGEVAPVTSFYTEEGDHVFFELQKNGVPVNPMIYMQ